MYLVEEAGSLLLEWGIINWCHIFVFKKTTETFNSTKHFSKSNIRNAFKKICPYQQPNKSLVNVNIAVTLLAFIHHDFTRCCICYIVVVRQKRVVFGPAYKFYLLCQQLRSVWHDCHSLKQCLRPYQLK